MTSTTTSIKPDQKVSKNELNSSNLEQSTKKKSISKKIEKLFTTQEGKLFIFALCFFIIFLTIAIFSGLQLINQDNKDDQEKDNIASNEEINSLTLDEIKTQANEKFRDAFGIDIEKSRNFESEIDGLTTKSSSQATSYPNTVSSEGETVENFKNHREKVHYYKIKENNFKGNESKKIIEEWFYGSDYKNILYSGNGEEIKSMLLLSEGYEVQYQGGDYAIKATYSGVTREDVYGVPLQFLGNPNYQFLLDLTKEKNNLEDLGEVNKNGKTYRLFEETFVNETVLYDSSLPQEKESNMEEATNSSEETQILQPSDVQTKNLYYLNLDTLSISLKESYENEELVHSTEFLEYQVFGQNDINTSGIYSYDILNSKDIEIKNINLDFSNYTPGNEFLFTTGINNARPIYYLNNTKLINYHDLEYERRRNEVFAEYDALLSSPNFNPLTVMENDITEDVIYTEEFIDNQIATYQSIFGNDMTSIRYNIYNNQPTLESLVFTDEAAEINTQTQFINVNLGERFVSGTMYVTEFKYNEPILYDDKMEAYPVDNLESDEQVDSLIIQNQPNSEVTYINIVIPIDGFWLVISQEEYQNLEEQDEESIIRKIITNTGELNLNILTLNEAQELDNDLVLKNMQVQENIR